MEPLKQGKEFGIYSEYDGNCSGDSYQEHGVI